MGLHTIVFAVNKHKLAASLHPKYFLAERERERERVNNRARIILEILEPEKTRTLLRTRTHSIITSNKHYKRKENNR